MRAAAFNPPASPGTSGSNGNTAGNNENRQSPANPQGQEPTYRDPGGGSVQGGNPAQGMCTQGPTSQNSGQSTPGNVSQTCMSNSELNAYYMASSPNCIGCTDDSVQREA